jgi:hypothetical protein
MTFEWFFNAIPLDWRMLPFNLLGLTLYVGASLLVDFLKSQPEERDFGFSEIVVGAFGLGVMTLSFALLWLITMKLKLPKFNKMRQRKRRSLNMNQAQPHDFSPES